MAQEWGEVEGYSARRRVRDGLEKGGKIREGEAHGERGRCDTQRGNKDRGSGGSRAYYDRHHLLHLFKYEGSENVIGVKM